MENIPSSFQLFGLTFHLYGLILGLSLLLGLWIAERVVVAAGYTSAAFWKLALLVIIGGLIGARSWHVMTDWPLYRSQPLASFYIWQGGLSILGAVVGGVVAALVASRILQPKSIPPLLIFFDATALGLPFAQALGRLGNWVNQELFGLPSNVPWAIFIKEEFRPLAVRQFSRFHPLFAYEALLMIAVGAGMWWLYKRHILPLGQGYFFGLYLFLYSSIRFCLDFLRLEKALVPGLNLGINQMVLLIVALCSGCWLLWQIFHQKQPYMSKSTRTGR